jgi:hypothetical protein
MGDKNLTRSFLSLSLPRSSVAEAERHCFKPIAKCPVISFAKDWYARAYRGFRSTPEPIPTLTAPLTGPLRRERIAPARRVSLEPDAPSPSFLEQVSPFRALSLCILGKVRPC